MARFYTLEEKKPKLNRMFLFLSNGRLHFGMRGKYADFIDAYSEDFEGNKTNLYYYELYSNTSFPNYLSEDEVLEANAMGNRIIDGWFYYPSTKNIVTVINTNCVSEVSNDQTSPIAEGDNEGGLKDYIRRGNMDLNDYIMKCRNSP